MTGPEHYREAARLIHGQADRETGVVFDEASSGTVATIALAQVHATLALAAATAVTIPSRDVDGADNRSIILAWHSAGAW